MNRKARQKKTKLTLSLPEKSPGMDQNGPLRINRILSLAGVSSRRNADEYITGGRVTLNGRVVRELGLKALWGKDIIEVDGKRIDPPLERVYVMLNKPFGYISTLNDPQKRPLARDLLKNIQQRIYSVGRLDFDSIGLLLFTNDGEFAHRLSHPRYHIPRTYKVTIKGRVTDIALKSLRNGVDLEDGFSGSSKAVLVSKHQDKSIIRLTIAQGRNRIVRRMMEAVGFKVIQLIRTGFGRLELGNLKVGNYRLLNHNEVSMLKKSVGME